MRQRKFRASSDAWILSARTHFRARSQCGIGGFHYRLENLPADAIQLLGQAPARSCAWRFLAQQVSPTVDGIGPTPAELGIAIRSPKRIGVFSILPAGDASAIVSDHAKAPEHLPGEYPAKSTWLWSALTHIRVSFSIPPLRR